MKSHCLLLTVSRMDRASRQSVGSLARTIPLQHDMVFVVGTDTPSSFAKVKKGTHEFQMKLPEFLLPAG